MDGRGQADRQRGRWGDGKWGWEERMDTTRLRPASCHPGPRESGACVRDAEPMASPGAPGHPLLGPCRTVRRAAQDPACCSTFDVTAPPRGRGLGDPGAPSSTGGSTLAEAGTRVPNGRRTG